MKKLFNQKGLDACKLFVLACMPDAHYKFEYDMHQIVNAEGKSAGGDFHIDGVNGEDIAWVNAAMNCMLKIRNPDFDEQPLTQNLKELMEKILPRTIG